MTRARRDPATFRTPQATRPRRIPSQTSTAPQLGHDSSHFTVLAEDITVGQGALDHLLQQDDLANKVIELEEEGEEGQGQGQEGDQQQH